MEKVGVSQAAAQQQKFQPPSNVAQQKQELNEIVSQILVNTHSTDDLMKGNNNQINNNDSKKSNDDTTTDQPALTNGNAGNKKVWSLRKKKLKMKYTEKELDELFASGALGDSGENHATLTDDPHPADKLLRSRLPSLRSIEVQVPFYDSKRNPDKHKHFSQRLADEMVQVFQSHYLSYEYLAHLAKQVVEREANQIPASTFWESSSALFDQDINCSVERLSASEIRFMEHFRREINKVNKFATSKINELENILADCIQRIMTANKSGMTAEQLSSIEKEVDGVAEQVDEMSTFVRHNKIGFHKIVQKYEKKTGSPAAWLLVYLEREPFWSLPLDHLIVAMSEIYRKVRAIQARTGSIFGEFSRKEVQTFQRKCFKFWVRPEDILAVKRMIIPHLPVQIFDKKPNFAAEDSIPRDLSDSSVISSIYFDNDKYDIYYGRLIRGEKRGNLIRIRWYGPYENPTTDVYMERKTHKYLKPGATESDGVKERFRMKAKYVLGYLKGENTVIKKLNKAIKQNRVPAEEGLKLVQIATEIQDEIVSKSLRPVLRTVYRRTAFQLGNNESHRISIDANLHIIEEPINNNNWYRDFNELLKLPDVLMFPYAILEIKLQEDPAPWVDALLGSGLLIPAYKFSKFNHGIAEFYPSKVTQMPHWYNIYHKRNHFPIFSVEGVSIKKAYQHPKRVTFDSATKQTTNQQGDEKAVVSAAGVEIVPITLAKPKHRLPLQSLAHSISAILNDKDSQQNKKKKAAKAEADAAAALSSNTSSSSVSSTSTSSSSSTTAVVATTTTTAPKTAAKQTFNEVAIDMFETSSTSSSDKGKAKASATTYDNSDDSSVGNSQRSDNSINYCSSGMLYNRFFEAELDAEIEKLKRKLRKKEKKKRQQEDLRKQAESQMQQQQMTRDGGSTIAFDLSGTGAQDGTNGSGNRGSSPNDDGLMEMKDVIDGDDTAGDKKKNKKNNNNNNNSNNSDKKTKKGSRRDPKVYLANERTLLSWLNMITFIAVAAISLLTLGGSLTQTAGLILMPLCIIYSFYSLFRYHIRRKGIIAGVMTGIDDYVGPYTFVGFLAVVLILVTIFSFLSTAVVQGHKGYAQSWPPSN